MSQKRGYSNPNKRSTLRIPSNSREERRRVNFSSRLNSSTAQVRSQEPKRKRRSYQRSKFKSYSVSKKAQIKQRKLLINPKSYNATMKQSSSRNKNKNGDSSILLKKMQAEIFLKLRMDSFRKKQYQKLLNDSFKGLKNTLEDFNKDKIMSQISKKDLFPHSECFNNCEFDSSFYISSVKKSLQMIAEVFKLGEDRVANKDCESNKLKILNQLKKSCQNILSPILITIIYFYAAKWMLVRNDYSGALYCCTICISLCYLGGNRKEYLAMIAYFTMAELYSSLKKYKKSIEYFTHSLQFAWVTNDSYYELQIYDKLSVQYYYLENMQLSKLFHARMISGYTESPFSKAREYFLEQFKIDSDKVRQQLG